MLKKSLKIQSRELESYDSKTIEKAKTFLANLNKETWQIRKFTIIMPPFAQPRPRARIIRQASFSRVCMYDPPEADKWKTEFGSKILRKLDPIFPIEGPVILSVVIYKQIPAGYSKVMKYLCENGDIRPEKRPDVDNYLKAVEDALNDIVWKDDSQIIKASCEKYYSNKPRIDLTVRFKSHHLDKMCPVKKEEEDE